MRDNVLRVGIGGPVGWGKTALVEALVPILIGQGHRPAVITNDIYTQEDAQHIRRTLDGVMPATALEPTPIMVTFDHRQGRRRRHRLHGQGGVLRRTGPGRGARL